MAFEEDGLAWLQLLRWLLPGTGGASAVLMGMDGYGWGDGWMEGWGDGWMDGCRPAARFFLQVQVHACVDSVCCLLQMAMVYGYTRCSLLDTNKRYHRAM